MKLHAETSHEIKLRATPENSDSYEASIFIKPHITIDCPALWSWFKEKLNIQESGSNDGGFQDNEKKSG